MNDQLHIDVETLDMLHEMLDEDFPGLLETFILDVQSKLESLKAGLASNDLDAVRRSAHSLKGSSSNLGANPLAELCRKAEQLAREQNLEQLDGMVKQIDAECQAVVEFIKQKIKEL